MSTILTEKDAATRHDALNECELKIAKASKDTVESMRVIGRELQKIKDECLYEVMGKNTFEEYLQHCLRFEPRLANAWMRGARYLELLSSQKLQLPYSQSQVLELIKIKDTDTMVALWQRILDYCDAKHADTTYIMVRDAVVAQRTKANERLTRARKPSASKPGIDIDLASPNGEVVREATWSEEGEKALNRIRRLCGDDIADAVDAANPKVSERDLLIWSEQEPEMIKTLGYWIVFKRMSLRKAMAYEENLVDMSTTVEQLGDLARSRGGRVHFKFQDMEITVEIAS